MTRVLQGVPLLRGEFSLVQAEYSHPSNRLADLSTRPDDTGEGPFEVSDALFEVWNALFDVWNALFEVSKTLFQVWNASFEVWNALFEIWNAPFEIWNALSEVSNAPFEVWNGTSFAMVIGQELAAGADKITADTVSKRSKTHGELAHSAQAFSGCRMSLAVSPLGVWGIIDLRPVAAAQDGRRSASEKSFFIFQSTRRRIGPKFSMLAEGMHTECGHDRTFKVEMTTEMWHGYAVFILRRTVQVYRRNIMSVSPHRSQC